MYTNVVVDLTKRGRVVDGCAYRRRLPYRGLHPMGYACRRPRRYLVANTTPVEGYERLYPNERDTRRGRRMSRSDILSLRPSKPCIACCPPHVGSVLRGQCHAIIASLRSCAALSCLRVLDFECAVAPSPPPPFAAFPVLLVLPSLNLYGPPRLVVSSS